MPESREPYSAARLNIAIQDPIAPGPPFQPNLDFKSYWPAISL